MTIVFIPALVVLLEAKEKEAGRELTRQEIESIRDDAIAVQLPEEIAKEMVRDRGYPDIDAESVWDEWLKYKKSIFR
ncbi:hypothetical protein B6N31_09240 [Dickeya fangzhongdai]|uniref:hypothetical protein n=1 Tax=Dickeya fangzhongdai TaxID=1778540 RepID=UPI000EAE1097|nr:hypothetical protein [Dickeya fangzhongdai]AYH47851.1 hypothetical protein B6N31_09240 [Dickeya fangzhongdai]